MGMRMSMSVRVGKAADQGPHRTPLCRALRSDDILTPAYAWLCHRRRDCPASSDVRSSHSNWKTEREQIVTDLLTGTDRFSRLTRTKYCSFTSKSSVQRDAEWAGCYRIRATTGVT